MRAAAEVGTPASRHGHTLVEVAIALVVLGLLALVAIPAGRRLADGAAVRGASAELASTFALARDLAIAEARPAAVHLDPTNGRALVVVAADTVRTAPLGASYGVTLRASRDSAAYAPSGLATGAANLSVVLARGAAADTLFVSRLGRVRR